MLVKYFHFYQIYNCYCEGISSEKAFLQNTYAYGNMRCVFLGYNLHEFEVWMGMA